MTSTGNRGLCNADMRSMGTRSIPGTLSHDSGAARRVVCFGMITPARVLVVDELPEWNTGAVWTEGAEFVSDDAAIVAGLLAGFGIEVELIGSALGDDGAGRQTVEMLSRMGVRGDLELRQDIETPFEVNISDSKGGRTYFWNRRPELLATLGRGRPLASGQNASLLYVDWYDSPYIERAMRYARQLDDSGVPEHRTRPRRRGGVLKSLIPYATICQAVTDASQLGQDAVGVARLLTE